MLASPAGLCWNPNMQQDTLDLATFPSCYLALGSRLTSRLAGRRVANGLLGLACAALFVHVATPGQAAERQRLRGHVPAAVEGLRALERLPGTNRLELAIGLPLRNRAALNDLLEEIYDPARPDYRHYLTPAEPPPT